ncbi:hypothetical protein [uncultured Nostoc sp.]|uniref:hypothetical protein n=1 Tax=uncultured Nostoc sp. TaxID=340711 RepID=UPI0035CB545D
MSKTDSAAIAQLYERLERFEANTNRTLSCQTVLLEEVLRILRDAKGGKLRNGGTGI